MPEVTQRLSSCVMGYYEENSLMGCSIEIRLKARISTPSYFRKGGTAISQSREASELAQYAWGREGAECNGDHWGLQLFTVSLSQMRSS